MLRAPTPTFTEEHESRPLPSGFALCWVHRSPTFTATNGWTDACLVVVYLQSRATFDRAASFLVLMGTCCICLRPPLSRDVAVPPRLYVDHLARLFALPKKFESQEQNGGKIIIPKLTPRVAKLLQ